MLYSNAKTGKYIVKNSHKFGIPRDQFMRSFCYEVINGEKYIVLTYKSSLEARAFMYFDHSPYVQFWSLEPFSLEYQFMNETHRYYPDFFAIVNDKQYIIEVKHSSDLTLQKRQKSSSEKLMTYARNQAKFDAAREYCKKSNITFIILTEKELALK